MKMNTWADFATPPSLLSSQVLLRNLRLFPLPHPELPPIFHQVPFCVCRPGTSPILFPPPRVHSCSAPTPLLFPAALFISVSVPLAARPGLLSSALMWDPWELEFTAKQEEPVSRKLGVGWGGGGEQPAVTLAPCFPHPHRSIPRDPASPTAAPGPPLRPSRHYTGLADLRGAEISILDSVAGERTGTRVRTSGFPSQLGH